MRKYLHLLAEEEENEIRIYSIKDAHFLRSPHHVSKLSALLQKVELDSFHVKRMLKDTQNDDKLLLVTIYFGKDVHHLVIDFMLTFKADKWLVKSIIFSNAWFDDEWY